MLINQRGAVIDNVFKKLQSFLEIRVPIIFVVASVLLIAGTYYIFSSKSHPPLIVHPPFPHSVQFYNSLEKETFASMFHSVGKPTCSGFFTVQTAGVGRLARKESCAESHNALSDRYAVWNEQMQAFNTTLSIYSNFHDAGSVCNFDEYSNLQMIPFEADALFERLNMTDAFKTMETWPDRRTRFADVMRLLLAYETRKTYIDTDIFFIDMHEAHYMHPFAGATVYRDDLNALEITNAAFCLPQSLLQRMLSFVDRRICLGSKKYFYTELGPSMFHKVLLNHYPAVALYSVNRGSPDLDLLAREALIYSHRLLHLSGHIRKGHPELSFKELTLAIQKSMSNLRSQLRRL